MRERYGEYIVTIIFNSSFASGTNSMDKIAQYLNELLGKYKSEVIKLYPIGERKFAYSIKHNQIGFYVFAVCKILNTQLKTLRRDLDLSSDKVVRFLILRKDNGEKVVNLSDLKEYKKEESFNVTSAK